ncbi:MAG: 3-deoxy-D-manno-octulosonic acid transferase, partial [Glaciimonas sp.]|nr:3-deoxy-D-manno-octulosonic acid transferase [Glaciimonas sp.]
SLLPLGGQNLIEACAVGKPVLIGPHTFNFAAVTEQAIAAGAALRVADARELWSTTQRLLLDAPLQTDQTERIAMAQNAANFGHQHSGATIRTMALLATLVARK